MKIPAKRTEFWCIYHKHTLFGKPMRLPVSAWPTFEQATETLQNMAEASFYTDKQMFLDEYMIEKMSVIMKSWEPHIV